MFCLAAIGGNISGMIASTKGADKILVIDGCNLKKKKKTLEEKGIKKSHKNKKNYLNSTTT